MLDKGMVSYLYGYLKKGYEIETLRNYLFKQGYNVNDIDEAVRYIQYYYPDVLSGHPPKQTVHHKIEISKTTLLAIFLIFLVIPVSGYFIFQIFEGGPDQLLDIKTEALQSRVMPGETIDFEVILDNYGSDKRIDTTITSKLFDSSGNVLDEKQIVKAVETKSTEVMSLLVPKGAADGKYRVLTELNYNGIKEETYFLFTVGDGTVEPTCSDGIKNQGEKKADCGGPCKECEVVVISKCEDGIRNQGEVKTDCGGPCPPCKVSCANCIPPDFCTKAECVDNTCVFTKKEPCCGNFYCEKSESPNNCPADCKEVIDNSEKTPLELKREAIELAKSDVEAAARICDGLDSLKDDCFKEISQKANQSVMCAYIESNYTKDVCYMNAVMQGDYSVCGEITDKHHRTTCNQLKKIASMTIPELPEGY